MSFFGVWNKLSLENTFQYRHLNETESIIILFHLWTNVHSIFISAIYNLSKAFHNASKPLSVDDKLELALPIAWLPTGFYYYLVLNVWESILKLPDYILSMAIVDLLGQLSIPSFFSNNAIGELGCMF